MSLQIALIVLHCNKKIEVYFRQEVLYWNIEKCYLVIFRCSLDGRISLITLVLWLVKLCGLTNLSNDTIVDMGEILRKTHQKLYWLQCALGLVLYSKAIIFSPNIFTRSQFVYSIALLVLVGPFVNFIINLIITLSKNEYLL